MEPIHALPWREHFIIIYVRMMHAYIVDGDVPLRVVVV